MSRLIDADKLIEEIKQEIDMRYMYSPKGFINVINNQPTAFDMCKVIGYLEKLKKRAEKQESIERYIAYDKAIDIVKAGGIR